jgi:hypothetical protein
MKTWLFFLQGPILVSLLVTNLETLAQTTTTQLTGTYRSPNGEFKVLTLSKTLIQIQFLGFYEYSTPSGLMAHLGEARGIANISKSIAVFKPEGTQNCILTLLFQSDKTLLVKQQGSDGDCGFGHNVTAEGHYTQVSHEIPIFEQF